MKTQYVICGLPKSGCKIVYDLLGQVKINNIKFFDKRLSMLHTFREKSNNVCTYYTYDLLKWMDIEMCGPAKFIVVIRDIRDILVEKFNDEEYWASCEKSIREVPRGINRNAPGLINFFKCIDRVTDPVFIKYENLVYDIENEQEYLREVFGFEGNLDNSHLTDEYIGQWKKYPERIRYEFEKCPQMGAFLIALEYEKDYKWLENL